MMAVSKILTAGVGLAALVGAAAPAAAQYYPGYGGTGNIIGQVLGQVLGGNRNYGYNNNYNSQASVQRCAAAVEQRINRSYGNQYGGYGGQYGGYGNQYGYANQGQARVLGVTSVERRSNSGLRVRGVATANANAGGYGSQYGGGYGGQYGYQQQPQGELRFKCNIDYRGYISDIDVTRSNNYGYRRY